MLGLIDTCALNSLKSFIVGMKNRPMSYTQQVYIVEMKEVKYRTQKQVYILEIQQVNIAN